MENAYAAGLFDGEGCISICGPLQRGGANLRVVLGNTYKPILEQLKAQFGGSVGLGRRATVCRLTLWQWTLSGDKAVRFLEIVFPYLVIKKEQAQIAFEFQKTKMPRWKHPRGGPSETVIVLRDSLFRNMRRLKKIDFPAASKKEPETKEAAAPVNRAKRLTEEHKANISAGLRRFVLHCQLGQ